MCTYIHCICILCEETCVLKSFENCKQCGVSPFGLVRLANSILAGCATRDTFKGVQPRGDTKKKKKYAFFLVAEFSMMNTWRKVFKFSGFFYLVLIRSNPGSFVHISILRVPPTPTFSVASKFLVKNQNRSKNDSKIVRSYS